ncbi:MAG: hypothetical protein O3C05_00010 [Proteobacteria bacterium]|nr:hypothetical protein [Pseudomonadota bacterium]
MLNKQYSQLQDNKKSKKIQNNNTLKDLESALRKNLLRRKKKAKKDTLQ